MNKLSWPGILRKVPSDDAPVTGIALPRQSAFLALLLLCAALAVSVWDHAAIDMVRNTMTASDSTKIMYNSFITHIIGFGKGDVQVMIALLLGFCGLKQRALAIICALIIVSLLVWPFKIIVHRERPRGNSFVSFPSGDAASAAACAQVLAAGSPVVAPVAALVTTMVCAGRVLGLAHYPSDVLAGSAFGIIAGIIGLEISKRYTLMLRKRYFLLLLVAYVSINELFCAIEKSHNGLSSFIWMYGSGICVVIAGRLIYLFTKKC